MQRWMLMPLLGLLYLTKCLRLVMLNL